MGKLVAPLTDVYSPPPAHPHADLFRDIPQGWEQRAYRGEDIWTPSGPGVISLPSTPDALATHVQLCGFVLDPDRAQVTRYDPLRGGRSITSPGIWQDVRVPAPEGDVVHTAVEQAAAKLTPAEMRQAAEALLARAEEV